MSNIPPSLQPGIAGGQGVVNIDGPISFSAKNNYGAAVAPTATDNRMQGYGVGSVWTVASSGIKFNLTGFSGTNATWTRAGSGNFTRTAEPGVSDDSTKGHAVGDVWEDANTGRRWKSTSVSEGAATWVRIDANAIETLTDPGTISIVNGVVFLSGVTGTVALPDSGFDGARLTIVKRDGGTVTITGGASGSVMIYSSAATVDYFRVSGQWRQASSDQAQAGSVVQVARGYYSDKVTVSVKWDDGGVEIFNFKFTPKTATGKLFVSAGLYGRMGGSTGSDIFYFAVYNGPNKISMGHAWGYAGRSGESGNPMVGELTPGSVDEITFSIRGGRGDTGSFDVNEGMASNSFIEVVEVAQ